MGSGESGENESEKLQLLTPLLEFNFSTKFPIAWPICKEAESADAQGKELSLDWKRNSGGFSTTEEQAD